jgi:hypothetical protein
LIALQAERLKANGNEQIIRPMPELSAGKLAFASK